MGAARCGNVRSHPADRAGLAAAAGLWPGSRWRRAVVIEPGEVEPVSGLNVAGGDGFHALSPLLLCRGARSCLAAGSVRRQLPPDARHNDRSEYGGDDDQADEDRGLLPPVTPG
jgi:hypothetical protein